MVFLLAGRKKGGKVCPTLPWLARYKVAVGVAEAIMYLHNGTEKCVVHRDIKPSNILLSSKKKPKVKKSDLFYVCYSIILFFFFLSSQ